MAINWYGSQSSAEGCNFGALAVVWPLLERMKLSEMINAHLPADPQAEYDHGRVLSLLAAARLYHPTALMNVAAWAAASGADILWDMPPEKINDDRLGRSLDAFFTQRHSILASVALHVAQEFGVSLSEIHYDPTHILFHGAYAGSAPREAAAEDEVRSDDGLPPAHITRGRPMPDAPKDVKLVHAGLCTVVDEWGPLPIFGHTVSGNENGRTAVAQQLALWRKHLPAPHLTMISDRGTFSAGHLARLDAEGYAALVAAPWNDFRPLFDEHREQLSWQEAGYLSIEQRRRREANSPLPREHYELSEVPHQLQDKTSGKTLSCRVIFVFSTADQKVARKHREKSVQKIRAALEKIQRGVAEGRRSTDPTAVARRVSQAMGQQQAAECFRYEMVPLSEEESAALPPPSRGCKRPKHRLEFSYDEQLAQRHASYDGYSVLVATRTALNRDELFTKWKQQCYSELANHEFKTPLAVHPVFLKSPQRVEALVFLMMLTLTVYFLLQRLYRQSLPADAPSREKRTTTETILRTFRSYLLILHHTQLGREVQPTRLTTAQRELLQRLGFSTPAQILSRRLPRAP